MLCVFCQSHKAGIAQDIAFALHIGPKLLMAATHMSSVTRVWVPRLQGARKWNKTKLQSNVIVFADFFHDVQVGS